MAQTHESEIEALRRRVAELEQALAERIRAEQARRESEEQWRSLVEHSPDYIAIVNRSGVIEFVNRTLTGLSLDDMMGRNLFEFAAPDRIADLQQILEQVFTAGAPVNLVSSFETGGSSLWLDTRIVPIKEGDTVVNAMIITTDITGHKHAEDALRASETRLRAILQVIPDLLLVIDEDGTYLDVQTTREDLLYQQARALIGQRIPEVLPEETARRFMEAIHRAISTRSLQQIEYKLMTVGGLRWFDSRIVHLDAPINRKAAVVWIARDITERKRDEELAAANEARFHAIVASVPGVIYRFVARGDHWRVDYVSPRVLDMFGIDAALLLRDINTFIARIYPDDFPTFTHSVNQAVAQKSPWNYEGRFVKPNGEIIWWQGISTVSVLTQDEIAFDGVLLDITERKRAEEERDRLIEELRTATHLAKESARLKSDFLSIMSHELRTPLNAIEGFTSIMLAGMGVSLEPKAQMMVERVSANSKRLLALMNDFLDLSKIEAGRMQLVSTPLSPRALMNHWRLEMSGLAEEKGLTFTTIVAPDVPDTLYGDEEAITRIATNLIYNAIKFTEQGRVAVQMRHQNNWLVLEVSDTGVGIPPHAQEYIFDEFRQLDSSSRRIHGGAGLGLALVRRLCHLMEGTVQVSSVVGEGSVFTVKLPLKTSLISERGA